MGDCESGAPVVSLSHTRRDRVLALHPLHQDFLHILEACGPPSDTTHVR